MVFRRALVLALLPFFFACGNEIELGFLPGLKYNFDGKSIEYVYTTFISDDFNRADETPLAAPWTAISGTGGDAVNLSTLVAVPSSTGATPPSVMHSTITTSPNVRVSVKASITGGNFGTATAGELRIYARAGSTANLNDTYFCGVDPTTLVVTIGSNVGGTPAPVATSTATVSYDNGDVYTLRFTVYGSSLTCELIATTGSEGIAVTATDGAHASAGYTGFAGGKNGITELEIDDFLVEQISTR